MDLMIIESPNKVKKIEPFVRSMNIRVMSSVGHVRSLDVTLKNKGAVEVDNGLVMHYINNPSNAKNTKEILNAAKSAKIIYLATDPDREGEAISWHLKELIKSVNKNCEFRRVTYQTITKPAILEAVQNYTNVNQNLVDAQFARTALDYLFGFHTSPVLWKVVARGLSAGRVQSPSLRLIVEREKEIRLFQPITYYQMIVKGKKDDIEFPAKLVQAKNRSLGKLSFTLEEFTQKEINDIKQDIQSLIDAGTPLKVVDIKRNKTSRKPKAPYTTSTLQADGVRKLGWSTTKVMNVAQKLFEGASGDHGFITYHRTDSVMLSDEALGMIFDYGKKHLGEYINDKYVMYTSKSKDAQEAHEAIRPTYIDETPESLKNKLDADEYKLYKMIWERTVASQMKPALFDSTSVSFHLGDNKHYTFKSNGSVLVFKGYLSVYQDSVDDDKEKEDEHSLPYLEQGNKVPVTGFDVTEHQTKPPPRFNEATLVEELTRLGIGRPSTYATIIKTLIERGYVKVENKRFSLMDIGEVTTDYLVNHFNRYVDYQFTSDLNNRLDKVALGELNWKSVVYEFWHDFKETVDRETKSAVSGTGVLQELEEICPKCGQANLKLMIGKFGKFKACSRGKKECGYIESLESKAMKAVDYFDGKSCPSCGGRLVVRVGFKGRKFLGCEHYGNKENPCKYSCNADGSEKEVKEVTDTGVKCPKCKKNNLVIRNGRFGKMFACSGFPKCRNLVKKDDFASLTGKTLVEVDDLLK